jgi:hypothetical protein
MNDKEKRILESLSKHLQVENVVSPSIYVSDEEKRLKEERLLRKWGKLLGESEHESIVEEAQPESEVLVEKSFVDAALDNAKTVTQPVFSPVEKQPDLPEKDFVTKSVEMLSKTTKKTDDLPVNTNDPIRNEINQLKKTVMDLHHFASRISQMSGGGGAADVNELDHATKLVTGDYTCTKKDYYIGVNSPTPCTITLPPNKKNGRLFIVKDESGNCATNRITIIASNGDTIDNDTSAIMGINNMTLQFIYRNGWRII